MAVLKIHRVLQLQAPLDPNAIYLVRVGEGFDMYVTDETGAIPLKMNGGTSEEPAPTVIPSFTRMPELLGTTAIGSIITVDFGAVSGNPTPTLAGSLTRPGKAVQQVSHGHQFPIEVADLGENILLSVTATNTAGSDTKTHTLAVPAASSGRIVDMNVKFLGMAVPRNELAEGGNAWLDAIATAGAKAVRFDFYFDQIQPVQGGAYNWSSVESLVDGCLSRGMHALGILTGIRAGSGETYATVADRNAFAAFAGAAAARFKGRVDHWAIYNEPNHGKMSAANYVELLKVTSPAIRAANPDAFITGPNMSSEPNPTSGLYTNNADFLNAIYNGGGQPHFDAIGFHPYTYPYWPDDPDGFTGWRQLQDVIRPIMVARGDGDKKIWLTEVGYPSGPTGTGVNQWYTEGYQDEVLDLYLESYKTLPYVGPMFWYSFQDRASQSGTEDFFGLRKPNGQNKLAYSSYNQHAASFPALQSPSTEAPLVIPAQNLWIGDVNTSTVLATVRALDATDLVLSAEPVGGGPIRTSTAIFDSSHGFARAEVTGLTPDTEYQLIPIINGGRDTSKTGRFRTRPDTRKSFTFGFASCGDTSEPSLIYNTIRQMIGANPFFYIGDRWYNDITQNDLTLFHNRERLGMSDVRRSDFHRLGPVLYMPDDHETGNDSNAASTAMPAWRTFFRSAVPVRPAEQSGAFHFEQQLAPGFHAIVLDLRSQRNGSNHLGTAQENWLLGRIAAIGASSPIAGLALFVMTPFIASSDSDTWFGASAQRQRVRDAIKQHMPGRCVMLAGDAHMLAFDDGTNNEGIPVYHAAPIGRSNSIKGGPYSGGTAINTRNQFATVDVEPTATGWTFRYRGYSVDSAGAATQRLAHTYDMKAPAPVQDSPPVISGDPVLTGTGVVGTQINATLQSVTGRPTPTETLVLLRDGQQAPETLPYTITEGDIEVVFTARHRAENALGVAERVSNPVVGSEAPAAGGAKASFITYANTLSPQYVLVDKSGAQWTDASGNNRHATIDGAEGSHTTSGPNGLPFFAGTTNSHAAITSDEAFNTGPFTVFQFIRPTGTIIDNQGYYHRGDGEKLSIAQTQSGVVFYRAHPSNQGPLRTSVTAIGEWDMVAMTYDPTTGIKSDYGSRGATDGIRLLGSQTATGRFTVNDPIMLNGRAIGSTIGRRGTTAFALACRFSRVLTESEIRTLYQKAMGLIS